MNQFQTPHVAMNPSHCTGCWKCIQECPKHAIGKVGFLWHKHAAFCKAEDCIGCRKCIKACPNGVFFVTDEEIKVPSLLQRMKRHMSVRHLLVLSLVATFISGIGPHVAGHVMDHQTWHDWAVAHVLLSTVCFVCIVGHIRRYASILGHTSTHCSPIIKRIITVSAALVFALTAITGFMLLAFVEGGSSHMGLWHYGLGIAMSLLAIVHRRERP